MTILIERFNGQISPGENMNFTDTERILESMLGNGGGCRVVAKPIAIRDSFRKLQVVFFCEQEARSLDECLHFSPAPNGKCTWRDESFLNPICQKEDLTIG